MIEIVELNTLTDAQVQEVIALMGELDPTIEVTTAIVKRTVEAKNTHFFSVMEGEHIIGCASLCVFVSPTGIKASIEDVVIHEAYRGQHLGKLLMRHVIDYAKAQAPICLQLTSRPGRVEANKLYQSLGFQRRETNAYRIIISERV